MNVEELKRLAEAATPGPWKWVQHYDYSVLEGPNEERVVDDGSGSGEWSPDLYPGDPDAQLIAICRTAVPELIAEVERLRAELEQARADADGLRDALEENGFWLHCATWSPDGYCCVVCGHDPSFEDATK